MTSGDRSHAPDGAAGGQGSIPKESTTCANPAAPDAQVAGVGLMEEQLRRANRELARSNAELEQFASAIAHDLKAPLASISNCAQLLLEEADHAVPDDCREMLGYIEDSAKQLCRLIQSLLEYSRAGKGNVKADECSMELALNQVLDRLRSMIQAAGARVSRDPLPVVFADEVLAGVLLQNLIENAIKHRGGCSPELHVSASVHTDGWRFAVRDNGRGIAPEHQEAVFQAFQRLHRGSPEDAGLGLGLATCKRIVERHGGRIWLESMPDVGSTFYFTLPALPGQNRHGGSCSA